MNSATYTIRRFWLGGAADAIAVAAVRPLQTFLRAPSLLFLGVLTVMLFRPPDLQCCAIDRFAFLLLVLVVVIRAFLLRQSLRVFSLMTWPMLGLSLLAIYGALTQPYDAQTWSLVAAKFIVPYTLFHLSILVFADSRAGRHFEIFAIVALAYLSFTAIAFLLDAKMLIFPRYILDESLGIHADRARGPFLQAVANGVTLNMLGLIALDVWQRGRIRGVWALALLIALPVAILATMTRAVWLSFAVSVMLLLFRSSSQKVRRACLCLVVAGAMGLVVALNSSEFHNTLQDRARERGPVEIRLAVYQAGWQMFLERPLSGWGVNQMPAELANRMTDYHLRAFWVHNTYLEILVEHGVVGIVLFVWIIVGLFRLGRKRTQFEQAGVFLDSRFRTVWPILVSVYLLNAAFVVMNYQFVNGLLFTLAGMLTAQNRSHPEPAADVVTG